MPSPICSRRTRDSGLVAPKPTATLTGSGEVIERHTVAASVRSLSPIRVTSVASVSHRQMRSSTWVSTFSIHVSVKVRAVNSLISLALSAISLSPPTVPLSWRFAATLPAPKLPSRSSISVLRRLCSS